MKVKHFRGLNNVSDPMRLGMEWFAQADNVDISETGAVSRRNGYALAQAGEFNSAFSTADFSRMYVVVGNTVRDFVGNTLAALTSTAPMFWTEVNENVYYNNGTDSGVIAPDNSVAVWRGAPRSYGAGFKNDAGEDLEVLYDTLPVDATVIQFWKGRIYAAHYMPGDNQTVIWFSEPMGFHLFNLDSNFFMVPGQATMLAPHDDALIVGTDARTYAYTGDKLDLLADYGVIPGQHWSKDDSRVLFWSARGLCAALPFANLTEKQVSVAPGVRAGGCIVRSGGQKRFLAVIQQGGEPFNAF